MRGRPKLEDSRDNQYRIRLNNEENRQLLYVSEHLGKPKSEIFRISLSDYYNKLRLTEMNMGTDDEQLWELDAISLKRVVNCPNCNAPNRVDLEDDCSTSTEDRSMGIETIFEFDYETECVNCRSPFRVKGYISEYPPGALNNEKINVSLIEREV